MLHIALQLNGCNIIPFRKFYKLQLIHKVWAIFQVKHWTTKLIFFSLFSSQHFSLSPSKIFCLHLNNFSFFLFLFFHSLIKFKNKILFIRWLNEFFIYSPWWSRTLTAVSISAASTADERSLKTEETLTWIKVKMKNEMRERSRMSEWSQKTAYCGLLCGSYKCLKQVWGNHLSRILHRREKTI